MKIATSSGMKWPTMSCYLLGYVSCNLLHIVKMHGYSWQRVPHLLGVDCTGNRVTSRFDDKTRAVQKDM